jgi:putative phosphoesterase
MKKIGLLSDTHGFFDPHIPKYFEGMDEIWHAGDIGSNDVIDQLAALADVRAVHGNIDGGELRKVFPRDAFFVCEQVPVWITHIGGYPGRYEKRVREYLAKYSRPKLFITGHSHILKVMMDKKYGFLHMNPGAAGISGFHQVRTLIRFEIRETAIENLEVIELGPRSRPSA